MELFEFVEGEVRINPEARQFRLIKAIIERDRGSPGDTQARKKLKAQKELSFVFFYCSLNHYKGDLDGVREKKIIRDLEMGDWRPDALIWETIDWIRTESETPSLKTLRILNESLLTFIDVIDEIRKRTETNLNTLRRADLERLTDEELRVRDKAIKSCSDDLFTILDFTQKVPKAIDTIDATKKKLDLEQKQSRIVGGKTANKWDS